MTKKSRILEHKIKFISNWQEIYVHIGRFGQMVFAGMHFNLCLDKLWRYFLLAKERGIYIWRGIYLSIVVLYSEVCAEEYVFCLRNKKQLKYCLFMAQAKAVLETNTQAISSCCELVGYCLSDYTFKERCSDYRSLISFCCCCQYFDRGGIVS